MKFVALTMDHWPWVVSRAGCLLCEDTKGVVALDDSGVIQGAVVFDNWSYTTASAHWAVDNPMALRAGLLDEGYRYVFETCGRMRLVGSTPADNERALRAALKLGWKEIYRLKDGWKVGVDMVHTQFLREWWQPGRLRRG